MRETYCAARIRAVGGAVAAALPMASSLADRVDICLDDYLESITGVPEDLRRTFDTIRALDERQCRLQAFTQRALSRHRSKPSTRARELRTEDAMDVALDIADEKIALSMQLYDVIDTHIRRLEDELKGIDARMRAEGIDPVIHLDEEGEGAARAGGGGGSGASAWPRGGGAGGGRRSLAPSAAGGGGGGGGGAPGGPGNGVARMRRLNVNPDHEVPINPSEPVYCICRQVAFGEMIACDNPDCEFEWFHYQVRGRACPQLCSRLRNAVAALTSGTLRGRDASA